MIKNILLQNLRFNTAKRTPEWIVFTTCLEVIATKQATPLIIIYSQKLTNSVIN